MATIAKLMPYLEQGYIAHDHVRRAYLYPQKQNGVLLFEWRAYEMEGEWSGPHTHSQEAVSTWNSDRWGILCHTNPVGGSEYATDEPEKIEEAISKELAFKADGFRDEAKEVKA